MSKLEYSKIVSTKHIGEQENPINLAELLVQMGEENYSPASSDKEKILLLCIDYQNDFVKGSLPVTGAVEDIARVTKFIYDNMEKITSIACSIDTHDPFQIFHPAMWVKKDGTSVSPFTLIQKEDIDSGEYTPVFSPLKAIKYTEELKKQGKKTLYTWPYHCLQGTFGGALENQFSNMVYAHSVARKSVMKKLVKGNNPFSEMYGIIKPEYDEKNFINLDFLNFLEQFDKILIAGEAKSHCVLESIDQILNYFANKPAVTQKIHILEDTMSSIQSFEAGTEAKFAEFKAKFNVNLTTTTTIKL